MQYVFLMIKKRTAMSNDKYIHIYINQINRNILVAIQYHLFVPKYFLHEISKHEICVNISLNN